MISLAPGTKVYLSSNRVSMRLGFDGLAALVGPLFAVEPYVDHVFLFRSRSRNYLKALQWDATGQAAGAAPLRLATAGGRGRGADASAVRAACRSDGLAPHRGPSGTPPVGADVGRKAEEKRAFRLGGSRASSTQNHVAGGIDIPENAHDVRALFAAMQAWLVASEQALEAERNAHQTTREQLDAAKNAVKLTTLQIEKLKT